MLGTILSSWVRTMKQTVKGPWFVKVCASVRRRWIQSTRKKFPVCLGEILMDMGVGKGFRRKWA